MGALEKVANEIEQYTNEGIYIGTVGRLRNGYPGRLGKGMHIIIMDYAKSLKTNIPNVMLNYYKSLLKEEF